MNKSLLVICIMGIGVSYAISAMAEPRPMNMKFSKPKYMHSDNPALQKADYVLPYKYLHYNADRIYEPQQYSCSLKNKLKYCVTRHGRPLNGQIVTTQDTIINYETYQNGYQSGITSSYTSDGVLIRRASYKKGVQDGETAEYYMNGNVYIIMKYKDGALNGNVEQYGINGGIVGEMTYKNGWFKSGYCKNERSGSSMHDRLKNSEYNEIIPCGQ